MQINPKLLDKYAVSGPRYTSYPTALQFNEQVGIAQYRQALEAGAQVLRQKPLSLYIHIPFCRSLCYYCGCHKVITQQQEKAEHYLNAIYRELDLQAQLVGDERQLKQIHFGGGTPTFLPPHDIERLLQCINQRFSVSNSSTQEVGIEIDPRTTSIDDIDHLSQAGFNRMSFGIQDFDSQVQIAINRIQDQQSTLDLIQAAKQASVESVAVDLIYGLPKQTVLGFEKTLDLIVAARPDRISLYHYAHIPNVIKSQKLIASTDLPNQQVKIELLLLAMSRLTAAGYVHIGMDHFALPDDSLTQSHQSGSLHRNFQGYSTHGDCDLIALGASAIGKMGDTFIQNYKSIKDYKRSIDRGSLPIWRGYVMSNDDQIRAALIQQIMCGRKIHYSEFNRCHQIHFQRYFYEECAQLDSMVEDGLLIKDESGFEITQAGRLLLRNIAMVFDIYLHKENHQDNRQRFF